MYHPSMWHPLDMATAFRSIRPPTSSPNTSPEKNSLSGFNAAFSVSTLLNQSAPSITAAAAAAAAAAAQQQHQLFSSLFQHYPYSAAFRPFLTGTSNPSSDSLAYSPAGKRFKKNSHDENHCETTSSSDDSFEKYSDHRCRSSTIDLQNPQCPICQGSFHGQEMITHVQHELDVIQRRQSLKLKRENKILLDTNNTIDQPFKTRYETFLRVRTSRQQRLNAKLQLHHRRSMRTDTRTCPICYQLIPPNVDDEYFFTHVQQCSKKREQLAAVTAIANHQHLPMNRTPIDDPDVNVVDLDDGIEREEKSSSGTTTTTSTSCQESFNSDQRYSPSTQTDSLYSKSPKCVVCMKL